ncbi:transmembrane protein 151B-like [Mercenaria mercenaria]|uniref:transmembrane protein 151B-like n=1 Tax=Mercenaria mercenaria TaxID=6596 RepID=UPI00234F928D|nr:transmembrane protein 151B-like [Mercenaria mercenaria]XP_045188037.2 transmembrane protein 151B-like [Mercenaria mercenaria]XP_045188038.2 transmembrane protein 151B-like [Mercenaria mercenaria]
MNRTGRQDMTSESDTETKQRPIKHSCCVSLRRDVHWKSLILTLLILGCLGAIAWCRLAIITTVVMFYERHSAHKGVSKSSPCADGYIYIPVAFVILLYLVYLVECWHCHTRIELKHKVDVQTVYHKMRQMREALPIIWWKALCFHYVRRTRQVTRYRNGDAFTSTQVYYERVNSHTAGCAFNFTNCGFKDDTKFVTGLEDYPATKIRFSKSYSFIHKDAKYEFDEQRNQFFTENERRDDYMETREGMDLLNVNFKEHMMAFKDPDNLPWYVSNCIFWIASFLMLSWPLRVIIEYKTAYIHYHVHKVFGTNYLNTEQSAGANIARTNTIGSAELELIVRNNFTIVPSYSEALLMNVDATSTRQVHDANANVTSPILGPTRSITWNNIANRGTSSGNITGFISSATIPNIIHSSSFHDTENVDILSPVSGERTFRSSLRNMLRSPWTRRRKQSFQSCSRRSNTMFMLSSPESLDGYSLEVDQRLQSVHLTRDFSSCNDVNVNTLTSTVRNCDNIHNADEHDSNSISQVSHPMDITNTSFQNRINTGNISNQGTGNELRPKPPRPCSFITHGDGTYTDENVKTESRKQAFIQSNLPKVPINNILTESCSTMNMTTPTPSSPPSYEQALSMHRPIPEDNVRNQSGAQTLPQGTSHTLYSAIMETSL